jgi:hypothetical protein
MLISLNIRTLITIPGAYCSPLMTVVCDEKRTLGGMKEKKKRAGSTKIIRMRRHRLVGSK